MYFNNSDFANCSDIFNEIINSNKFYCSLNSAKNYDCQVPAVGRQVPVYASGAACGRTITACDLFSKSFLHFENSQEVAEQKAYEFNSMICPQGKDGKNGADLGVYISKHNVCPQGKFFAQNGYLNFSFENEFLATRIALIAEKFDKIYKNGLIDKVLYDSPKDGKFDTQSFCPKGKRGIEKVNGVCHSAVCPNGKNGDKKTKDICGSSARYIINRIVSVCDTFGGGTSGLCEAPAFCGVAGDINGQIFEKNQILRDIAVLCVFLEMTESENKSRTVQNLARAFVTADSCISNSSMIYLNLYKACGYLLFKACFDDGESTKTQD